MVDSGTVLNDLSYFESDLETYSSSTGSIGSSWAGPSYDNFLNITEDFIGEFKSTISGEMNSFSEACAAYKEYETACKNLEDANYNVSLANQANKSSDASYWSGKASEYKTQKETLKQKIEAALVAASSAKLDATSLSGGTTVSASSLPDNLILSESGYVFPFAKGVDAPITSHVGLRNAPTAGASSNHKGTDIGVAYGTEIYAISGGTVINAGRSDAGGFGNWVRIQQDDGNVVTYGHVSKSDYYNVGDRVEAGDLIANVGSEGVSTGPHLHLEIHDSEGNVLDSENFFEDVWYA